MGGKSDKYLIDAVRKVDLTLVKAAIGQNLKRV
jgi:hypothetical protein